MVGEYAWLAQLVEHGFLRAIPISPQPIRAI
jgi:hypothetical protein